VTQWKRSHEPLAWSLFGGGGMVLAFFGPALVIITGLLMPWLLADDPASVYRGLAAFAGHPGGKLMLLVLIALPLFHTVHRLYHGLHDLHLAGPRTLLQVFFYGGATVLSLITAGWLLMS
jgi:fumarate reductase subunit D